MSTIEESVEVQVPIRTAYDQWTQFEEFPESMEGVVERFKGFIERRSSPTGAWRGTVG